MQYIQIVSGLNHAVHYSAVQDLLVPGTELILEPNPENPYDKQAIKVIFDTDAQGIGLDAGLIHIGWIPMKRGKELNLAKKEIFEAIEAGVSFKAEVLLHDLHRPLYDRLTISIKSDSEDDAHHMYCGCDKKEREED